MRWQSRAMLGLGGAVRARARLLDHRQHDEGLASGASSRAMNSTTWPSFSSPATRVTSRPRPDGRLASRLTSRSP